jgi:adenylate cyclase
MRDVPLILVVDDVRDNIEIVRLRLESQSFNVITAERGEEALEKAASALPDLILLDVMMPGIDGIETVKRLKADTSLPFIPVILLTARSDTKEVIAGLDSGADDYLTKPFDHDALLARVRAMLRIKALHDTVQAQRSQLEEQASALAGWNQTLEQRVAEQLTVLKHLDWLKRFLAPQIAELVITSGDEILQSHRRHVAVVFCDLRGFTSFSEVAEPEEQIVMLAEYHAILGTLINSFQGTLIHIVGDGVMVVFNDPIPCSDPCLQAVRMAIEMRSRVGALMAKWQTHGYDLGFGIGISQGYATLGLIGFESRSQYTAIGTVTNLASRLCGEAADGQIFIDSKAKTVLDARIDTADVGDLMLKGLRRPIRVFNILGLTGARG